MTPRAWSRASSPPCASSRNSGDGFDDDFEVGALAVDLLELTASFHFERELAIVKLKLATGGLAKAMAFAKKHGAEILDDAQVSCTIQLTGRVSEVDAFVTEAADVGDISAVARSGSVAVSKGEVTLSSFDTHHRLSA